MSLAYGDPDVMANAMTGRPGPHIMYVYMPEDFKAKTAPSGLEKTHTQAGFLTCISPWMIVASTCHASIELLYMIAI
jgi:hypothetical protein